MARSLNNDFLQEELDHEPLCGRSESLRRLERPPRRLWLIIPIVLFLLVGSFLLGGHRGPASFGASMDSYHQGSDRAAVVYGADEGYALLMLNSLHLLSKLHVNEKPDIFFLHPPTMNKCTLDMLRGTGAKPVTSGYAEPGGDMSFIKLEMLTNPIFRNYGCLIWIDADTVPDVDSFRETTCHKFKEFGTDIAIKIRKTGAPNFIQSALSPAEVNFSKQYDGYPGVESSRYILFPAAMPETFEMQRRIGRLFQMFRKHVFSNGEEGMIHLLFDLAQLTSTNSLDPWVFRVESHLSRYFLSPNAQSNRGSCGEGSERVQRLVISNGIVSATKEFRNNLGFGISASSCPDEASIIEDCHERVVSRLKACSARSDVATVQRAYELSIFCLTMWSNDRLTAASEYSETNQTDALFESD
mmetsp:Transcript_11588/g.23557  ORF Transcript_11588/g.23557 Transcript_11588/m.23557 type:complete len:414 (-) Transcript_11588:96-1337(-)